MIIKKSQTKLILQQTLLKKKLKTKYAIKRQSNLFIKYLKVLFDKRRL